MTPGDIREQFPYVVSHRLLPNAAARMENLSRAEILADVLKTVPGPPMGVKAR